MGKTNSKPKKQESVASSSRSVAKTTKRAQPPSGRQQLPSQSSKSHGGKGTVPTDASVGRGRNASGTEQTAIPPSHSNDRQTIPAPHGPSQANPQPTSENPLLVEYFTPPPKKPTFEQQPETAQPPANAAAPFFVPLQSPPNKQNFDQQPAQKMLGGSEDPPGFVSPSQPKFVAPPQQQPQVMQPGGNALPPQQPRLVGQPQQQQQVMPPGGNAVQPVVIPPSQPQAALPRPQPTPIQAQGPFFMPQPAPPNALPAQKPQPLRPPAPPFVAPTTGTAKQPRIQPSQPSRAPSKEILSATPTSTEKFKERKRPQQLQLMSQPRK